MTSNKASRHPFTADFSQTMKPSGGDTASLSAAFDRLVRVMLKQHPPVVLLDIHVPHSTSTPTEAAIESCSSCHASDALARLRAGDTSLQELVLWERCGSCSCHSAASCTTDSVGHAARADSAPALTEYNHAPLQQIAAAYGVAVDPSAARYFDRRRLSQWLGYYATFLSVGGLG